MNLELIADDLGVQIRTGVLPHNWWGAYDFRTHTITLLKGLGPIQYKSTLCHELGHAHYRHRNSTTNNEWQANVWAARKLIDHEQFMEAALGADRLAGVAAILEVMPVDVETYMRALPARELRRLQKHLSMAKAI